MSLIFFTGLCIVLFYWLIEGLLVLCAALILHLYKSTDDTRILKSDTDIRKITPYD